MSQTFTNNMRKDASGSLVSTASGLLTIDASASPKSSPLAIDTNIVTITVPATAAEIILKCDVALRISEDSTMTHYYTQAANLEGGIGLANSSVLYVRTNSGSGTLNFRFNTV